MQSLPDYYACLNVPRSASTDEIRQAFRKMARRFHPDANADPHAAEEFKLIAAAHETLTDSAHRAEYDARLSVFDVPFSIEPVYSRNSLRAMPEPQVVYCLLNIKTIAQTRRIAPALNLCLVIDRSTSMQGARLDHTKSAARQIIEGLDENDFFSIVAFSDRAEVIFPSQSCDNKPLIISKVNAIQANGGTEILEGLMAGLLQLQENINPKSINHLTLLTDGRTYGDEENCLLLGTLAELDGIVISGLGIGDEWNDVFLDQLTATTGGESLYVHTIEKVEDLMVKQVRGIGGTIAQRLRLQVTCDADIKLRSAFRIYPEAYPIPVDDQPLRIGSIPRTGISSILLEFVVKTGSDPRQNIARTSITGDILNIGRIDEKVTADLTLPIGNSAKAEPPPLAILQAMDKLTLYRLQEKAWAAAAEGKVREATQHLEMLASRLLTTGEHDLAQMTVEAASRLGSTNQIPSDAKKRIKYGTRAIISKI
ncbi:MAG: DnaJ domain-containing protein [Chloroflexota bacterium]